MAYGVGFIGDKATVVADRSDWTVIQKTMIKLQLRPFNIKSEWNDIGSPVRNFLDFINTIEQPLCPIESGRNVAFYAHMGNIAARSVEQALV